MYYLRLTIFLIRILVGFLAHTMRLALVSGPGTITWRASSWLDRTNGISRLGSFIRRLSVGLLPSLT